MGFYLLSDSVGVDVQQKQQDAVLHKLGCKACPLNQQPGRMEPTGADKPLVYMIGEAPGATEIEEGEQFVGASGQLLRPRIPRAYRGKLRWNNVVRSRPPNNRTPERAEIESCRPSIVADIEASKPKAIFGFGSVPLNWVSGFSGVSLWRGRRMPVKVGKHACWYYPMFHPSYLLRQGRNGSEDERIFRMDLRRAFAELPDLPEPVIHTEEDARANVEILSLCKAETLRRLEVLLGSAAKEAAVGIDYETQGTRPYGSEARILTAAVSAPGYTFTFPFDHPDANWSKAHRADLQKLWMAFLKHCKAAKVVHNLAFELEWTGVMFGEEFVRAGRWEDTASQACILDERTGKMKPGPMSLEFLVQQYFGFNLKSLAGVNRADLANEPLEAVLRYNAPDAKYHLLLWEAQKARLEKEKLVEAYELALRRVPTITISQMRGVPVDGAAVKELQDKYERRIAEIETRIKADPLVARFKKEAGKAFNPQSTKDVLYLFVNILKRTECTITDKKTKKERASVDASVLEQLVKKYPLAQHILDLRKPLKIKSTYLDPMAPPSKDNPDSVLYPDGLLHCRFNTIFAETGRLSAEEPNLQNYPKREEEAKEARRPIAAKAGEMILAFDYGQIEARVIAMFTRDKRFVDYLWSPKSDVHMDWAQKLAAAYPDRVGGREFLKDKKTLKKFRTDVKNQWTFPLFFGANSRSVSKYLSIPEEVIDPLYNAFWREFSDAKDWQERQLDFYYEYGYVECLTGRRRRGPLTVNQVYNTPVQGTAAEIVLDAMSRLSETGEPLLHPEINIHDDLTFLRIPKDKFDFVVENVVTLMLDVPFEWAKVVPLSVELSVGNNWMAMEEVEKFDSVGWLGHKRGSI